MNKSAILHIPQSQYAYALSEHTLTIRIRTGKNDLTSCSLYYGDRACRKTPVDFNELPMELTASDELFDYYEVTFDSPYQRVCYYFKLTAHEEWLYYYGEQFKKELPDITLKGQVLEGRSEYFQFPFILRSEIHNIPEWFHNSIVYNIFPDSFATGKESMVCECKSLPLSSRNVSRSRLGGTLRGVIENLDYIEDLGFNCIYLNPIFTAGEYHKYDLIDYYHIDPCLGTDEDFRELVDKIHNRGMRIIIDGVFNHCGWHFFAFEDVMQYGENSIYKDWFYELTFPVKPPTHTDELPDYSCFAYEKKMPKLNTANPQVIEYFKKVCKYWIKEFKIDGWRLDVANEIDKNFWRSFRQTAKEANPDIVLIGEVWENADVWLKGDMFDSTMNYDFRRHCRDFFALQTIDGKTFAERLNQMNYRYPLNITLGQLNLLDSHDVARFLTLCQDNIAKWKLAALFLFLYPGVPCLFYGDEKGISGITENEYRSPMPWDSSDKSRNLTAFIKNLISIRKTYLHSQIAPQKDTIKTAPSSDQLLIIEKRSNMGKLVFYMNVGAAAYPLETDANRLLLMAEGIQDGRIDPDGYAIYAESGTV
jgi:glycosidase